MCGICGYISRSLISDTVLNKMNDTMIHRGPDDNGVWQYQKSEYAIGFAQRRLAILDLSILGHQPMQTQDGNLVITYNGEIYNFLEIRKELEKKGYQFISNCDTEVVLTAFLEWDTDCFSKFNGMFAIALYDKKKDRVILARDRIGKKPLYYYHCGEDFVFASELKPIMKYPNFKKNINRNAVGFYFCNKFIAAPSTIFENTYKLEAGTYLIWEKKQIRIKRYWDIVEKQSEYSKVELMDYSIYKKELCELLLDSVKSRMIADVPVGSFLSGGIDSTLITALSKEVSIKPVKSFSIGFYDAERNEAPYAKEIAKHLGTEHQELYVSEKEIFAMLQDLPVYYDEPFSDSSQLPSMLVSKMAVSEITVALSGDGGDELFCGYSIYDLVRIAQKTDKIGNIIRVLPGIGILKGAMPPELRAFINNDNPNRKIQLFTDVMADEVRKILVDDLGEYKFEEEDRLDESDWQIKRMLLDMQTYLPDEVLCKMDRASMKYSLEVRCPLLDYRVIEYSFRIPQKYKYTHGDKKHILKELAYEYVPKELLERPKKGFGVPLRKWIRTVLHQQIMHYANGEILKKQGIFNPVELQRIIHKQKVSNKIVYSSILWSFYVFQRWYQCYIEDLWN